jgi:hypothetical protein
MLLVNLLPCPSTGSVKLNDSIGIPPTGTRLQVDIEFNFVHAVLKAIEGENSSGTPNTKGLDSLKHLLRSELEKELRRG